MYYLTVMGFGWYQAAHANEHPNGLMDEVMKPVLNGTAAIPQLWLLKSFKERIARGFELFFEKLCCLVYIVLKEVHSL
jgi:hypothetical protein